MEGRDSKWKETKSFSLSPFGSFYLRGKKERDNKKLLTGFSLKHSFPFKFIMEVHIKWATRIRDFCDNRFGSSVIKDQVPSLSYERFWHNPDTNIIIPLI